jgi:hypothetical protein
MALIRALRVRTIGTTLTLDEEAQVFLPDSSQISAQSYKTSN